MSMSVRATDCRRHARLAVLALVLAAGRGKAAIQQSAHDNYVGPWLSSFLKRRGL
jgi:hypothetical protein